MKEFSLSRIREVLDYEPATGVFRWKLKPNRRIRVGDAAGSRQGPYVVLTVDGVDLLAHRVAWALTAGAWPASLIDHRDRNKRNNAAVNLREADRSLNAQNMALDAGRGATRLRGVSVNSRRGGFTASIHIRGESHYLGSFADEGSAHAAYVAAKATFHAGAIT